MLVQVGQCASKSSRCPSLRGTSPRTHGPRNRHESECRQHLLSACGDARPPARRPPSCSPPEHALRRNDTSLVPGPNKGVHGSLPQAFRRCSMDKQLASWPRRGQRCSMGALQWSCVPAAERGFQDGFAQVLSSWRDVFFAVIPMLGAAPMDFAARISCSFQRSEAVLCCAVLYSCAV